MFGWLNTKNIGVGVTCLILMACSPQQEEEVPNDIHIGIAWPRGDNYFIEGAELAAQEINANGGLLGKELHLLINEQEATVREKLRTTSALALGDQIKEIPREMAHAFLAESNRPVAVIGHRYSFLALTAVTIYQRHRMLYIAPTATNMALTTLNFDMLFRMLQNNEELSRQLAIYAGIRNFKRIAILSEYDDYSMELTLAFARIASEQRDDIKTVYRHSFFGSATERDFTRIAVELQRLYAEKPFDAIAILTSASIAEKIFRYLRERGRFEIPILGSESLDTRVFWSPVEQWQKKTGRSANIAVPTVFYSKSELSQRFTRKFKEVFNADPGRYAALGYDSVKAVAQAIRLEQSVKSETVADSLRYMLPCRGVTGRIEFEENGDVKNKTVYIKILTKDGFHYETLKSAEQEKIDAALPECMGANRGNDVLNKNLGNTPKEVSKNVHTEGPNVRVPLASGNDTIPDYLGPNPYSSSEEVSHGIMLLDSGGGPNYRDQSPHNIPSALSKGVDKDEEKPSLDGDYDQVPDDRDQCPRDSREQIAKGVDKKGCPVDSDGDGVADYRDRCVATTSQELAQGVDTEGCPINSAAKCGTANASATNCPLDSDQDGVVDSRDRCANTEPGLKVDASGCTVVKKATFPVDNNFSSNDKALTESMKAELKKFISRFDVTQMHRLEVVAYTDSIGNKTYNQRLSEKRAAAVAAYLVEIGVPAKVVSSRGMGEEQPIADNTTAAGVKNRRFEIHIDFFSKQKGDKK